MKTSRTAAFGRVGRPGRVAVGWAAGMATVGRGPVDDEYRIGKYEITTGQWLEFAHVAYTRADRNPFLTRFAPGSWGGRWPRSRRAAIGGTR